MPTPTPQTAQDFATAIGRAQQAYKAYGTPAPDGSVRTDLQQGASTYADGLRAQAKTAGIDLTPYGTQNAYGMDFTKNYTSTAAPNAYDPTKAGQQVLAPAPPATGGKLITDLPTGGGAGWGTDTTGNTDKKVTAAPNNGVPTFQSTNQYGQLSPAQLQQQVDARFAKLGLSMKQGVDAYNTSRTNAFNYANQTTQGNRALLQFDNSNRGDQRGGSAREDKFRLDRSQSLEDTASNNIYQADMAANNQKLSDFYQSSPEQQQAMYDQLMTQERGFGQQQDQLNLQAQGQQFNQGMQTNQFNSQQQNQAFNQNLATNQFNQQAQNQNFNQNLQLNEFAYKQVRDSIGDAQYKAKFDNDVKQQGFENALKIAVENRQITNDQAQRAISQQNANASSQNANTSSKNAAWAQDPTNPDNLYKQSEIAKNNAVKPTTKSLDSTYVENLQGMSSDKRDSFFKNEKANIIKDLGISGYNQLYNMYYDQYGAPKQ